MWYRREEAQKRYTFFFASTTLAGAFGGLLASAIGKMQGLRGKSLLFSQAAPGLRRNTVRRNQPACATLGKP